MPFRPEAGARLSRCAGLWCVLGAGLLSLFGCGSSTAKPVTHRVVIQGFQFEPSAVRIALGDTVEWINQDIVPHTATARDGAWDSKSIAPRGIWRTVPPAAPSRHYVCLFHPTMRGEIMMADTAAK